MVLAKALVPALAVETAVPEQVQGVVGVHQLRMGEAAKIREKGRPASNSPLAEVEEVMGKLAWVHPQEERRLPEKKLHPLLQGSAA